MLYFVICEDDPDFAKAVKKIVDNFMMNFDTEYEIKMFSGYGEKFHAFAALDNGFKIYLMDIKAKPGSGLDAARYVREELDDWVSIITIITSFNEYRYEALGNRLYLLDFISKFDNCENRIKETLDRAMKHYNKREKMIKFEYNYTTKQVELRHIIYIEKEQDSKRCQIHTTYGVFTIPKTLNDTSKLLDERFLKVHRSMLVNKDHIDEYDSVENVIKFKNGETTNLISRGMKKEVRNICQK